MATITVDLKEVERNLLQYGKQAPFAIAGALNDVAFAHRARVKGLMEQTFDRPVPLTVNSLLVNKATKGFLVATTKVRDEAFKGTPPVKYLYPEIEGGRRRHKRFELALIRAGIMAESEYALPGQGVRLNQYGNISAGLITQILSAVRANPDPFQDKTKRSRSKAVRTIFASRGGHLPRGVWQRTAAGTVSPLLIFTTKAPTYRKRINFEGQAIGVFNEVFVPALTVRLARAIATAK